MKPYCSYFEKQLEPWAQAKGRTVSLPQKPVEQSSPRTQLMFRRHSVNPKYKLKKRLPPPANMLQTLIATF